MMMELLKTAVKQPLKVNQLQLSATFTPSFEAGFHVNMEGPKAAVRDGSVFEYCRLNDTVIQAWSVLHQGLDLIFTQFANTHHPKDNR